MSRRIAKQVIHINQHLIKQNTKTGERNPVITVKQGRVNNYADSLEIIDADGNTIGRLKYQPDNPLSCGARVWLELYPPNASARLDQPATPSQLRSCLS
jgi:hypothetical protein